MFQEPIELSHYPSAYKPPPGTKPKIERDDFPAPPYPYTDPGNEITITKNSIILFVYSLYLVVYVSLLLGRNLLLLGQD